MIDYFTRSFSLFRYESGKWHCLKCMVVHENHPNVLQYKESEWIRVQQISYAMTCPKICIRTNICLHEFFRLLWSNWKWVVLTKFAELWECIGLGWRPLRLNRGRLGSLLHVPDSKLIRSSHYNNLITFLTDSINSLQFAAGIARNGGGGGADCPFQGIYTFSYSTRGGTCAQPPSQTASCTDKSKMVLRYQACPDVAGSESHGKATLKSISLKRKFEIYFTMQYIEARWGWWCGQSILFRCPKFWFRTSPQ